MIPKTIHYCWFGRGEKPKLAKKCIESWKKFCPDYEIIEWNEDNFDVNMNAYTKMCYEQKKYAFLSDYVRLLAINDYGGLYFDTDVEVIKSFDNLLGYKAFYGFENDEYVASGLGFGSERNHVVIKELIKEYDFLLDGENGTRGCPRLNTSALVKLGLAQNGKRQNIFGAEILPSDYLNPYDDPTGRLNKTTNTYSIHWYGKSWMNKRRIIKSKITQKIHRLFGVNSLSRFKRR